MQKCPKCGYNDGVDWPVILWVVAFGFLYLVFIGAADFAPRSYRLLGGAAFTLFSAGTVWKALRDRQRRRRHELGRESSLPSQ
jgi:hypothetical protein